MISLHKCFYGEGHTAKITKTHFFSQRLNLDLREWQHSELHMQCRETTWFSNVHEDLARQQRQREIEKLVSRSSASYRPSNG